MLEPSQGHSLCAQHIKALNTSIIKICVHFLSPAFLNDLVLELHFLKEYLATPYRSSVPREILQWQTKPLEAMVFI